MVNEILNNFLIILRYAPSVREEQWQQKYDYFWSGTMKIILKVYLLVGNSLKVLSLLSIEGKASKFNWSNL